MKDWKVKKTLLKGAVVTTTFEPMEREVLGELAATVAEALINRCQSAPKDELAELTGMPSGHKDPPKHPSMARLLPDFERPGDEEFEGDNQLLRSLHENDICRGKLTNLQAIIADIGPDGSVQVSIPINEIDPWIQGLNDMRLFVAADRVFGHEGLEEQEALVEWLAFCQESLLDALYGQ